MFSVGEPGKDNGGIAGTPSVNPQIKWRSLQLWRKNLFGLSSGPFWLAVGTRSKPLVAFEDGRRTVGDPVEGHDDGPERRETRPAALPA